MISIPKKSDMAVAFRLVPTQPEDNDLIRSLQLSTGFTLDALADMFQAKNSDYFIKAFLASWIRVGIKLSEKKCLFSVAAADPFEIISLYETLAEETREEYFDLLDLIGPEVSTIITMYQEFGNSNMLSEQLAVTCYRICEAAFLATRKPHIMKTKVAIKDD